MNHLAIIIDGNRRWAKNKGLPSFNGHKKGFEKVIEMGEYCLDKGIKTLSFYCFSTENWKRAKREVTYLMKLLELGLSDKNLERFNKKEIRLRIVGQKEKLPKSLQKRIKIVEESTKDNQKGTLNLLISYGGRNEIVEAVKKIVKNKQSITEKNITENLSVSEPDLIIRTSGEQRLSNFLTWQSAYSELYFCKKHWPDFNKTDLNKALEDYNSRQRRFGK